MFIKRLLLAWLLKGKLLYFNDGEHFHPIYDIFVDGNVVIMTDLSDKEGDK